MSITKVIFSGFLLFLMAACGFTPMYGSGTEAAAGGALNNIEIAMIPDESGVYLRNDLIDRFYQDGYPSSPTHRLVISPIEEIERDLDITIESEATRKQAKLNTVLTLIDNATGKTVLSRRITAVTSYNVSTTQFATRISEMDAREAALHDLARQIENHLALYFQK